MINYSNEIIYENNIFVLKNYNNIKLVIIYVFLFFVSILYFFFLSLVLRQAMYVIFHIIVFTILYCLCFFVLNSFIKISIDKTNNKIVFSKKSFPIRCKRILNFENIKEISINCTIKNISVYYPNSTKEIIYNVDIIDKELNCYRLYAINAYNDDFIEFAKKLSSILNIKINDQNKIEGIKNIYKKRIF